MLNTAGNALKLKMHFVLSKNYVLIWIFINIMICIELYMYILFMYPVMSYFIESIAFNDNIKNHWYTL